MKRTLILGYGNTLRGDDAVGPRFAETVASWQLPGVWARSLHGLTPEWAETITHFDRVLFVDAAEKIDRFELVPLIATSAALSAHGSDPEGLLGLAQCLYDHCPPAWLVKLPAASFDFDEHLSDIARGGLSDALLWVKDWLKE